MVIKLKSSLEGRHIHEQIYMGPDKDHLALIGELVYGSVGEWQIFGAAMLLGAERTHNHLEVIIDGSLVEGSPELMKLADLD